MTANYFVRHSVRVAMFGTAAALCGAAVLAQDREAESGEATQTVVVTGSRMQRQDFEANSPLATVSQGDIVGNADITLETFLNTLPQIVPGATTTTNNPSNNGQANIDLRGLGPNRNLVLIDGRRPMVSTNDLTVDLNTIPAALIDIHRGHHRRCGRRVRR